MQKMVSGRGMVESFRVPYPAPGSDRIGEVPTERPTNVVELKCSPGFQLVGDTSRESTSTAPNTMGQSTVEIGNESAPAAIPGVHS